MSAQTENFALPIPDNRPEKGQSGYAAILAVRNALIEIDALLKAHATAIGGKADGDARWDIEDVEGLLSALESKMDAAKKFALGDLTDVAGLAGALVGYVLALTPDGNWGPASAQALMSGHQHYMSEVQGLLDALADKVSVAAVASALAQKASTADLGDAAGRDVGTTAGTVAAGDDARFTDAREWTAEVVTQAEAEAGSSDEPRQWTAERVRQNALAAAVGDQSKATAWVNFNGKGTVTIRSSYNVSSITDNGVGDYSVNFLTPMVNTNYATQATCKSNAGSFTGADVETQTLAYTRVRSSNVGTGIADTEIMCVAVFGG